MFTLFAGPCVIESAQHADYMCQEIKKITDSLGIPFVFKSSFDKANRTSGDSYRGPGLELGVSILKDIKEKYNVDILTDIHEPWQAKPVADVAEFIQIPAFLCRQTDLLVSAGNTKKNVVIKKGQFMSASNMRFALDKVYSTGNRNVFLCERGTTFGYNQLIVDMTAIVDMKSFGVPVIFDATHSIQRFDNTNVSKRQYVLPLTKSALGAGADHLFMEVHNNPDCALSDARNMIDLSMLKHILVEAKKIYNAIYV